MTGRFIGLIAGSDCERTSACSKWPAGFGVFSQFTGHYLYIESKRAIIYTQNKVIEAPRQEKTIIYDRCEGPGRADRVVSDGLLHMTISKGRPNSVREL